jgi:hypothetical protein
VHQDALRDLFARQQVRDVQAGGLRQVPVKGDLLATILLFNILGFLVLLNH